MSRARLARKLAQSSDPVNLRNNHKSKRFRLVHAQTNQKIPQKPYVHGEQPMKYARLTQKLNH